MTVERQPGNSGLWVADEAEDSRPINGGSSYGSHDSEPNYAPRLRIGFQTTPKPVYRIAARSREI